MSQEHVSNDELLWFPAPSSPMVTGMVGDKTFELTLERSHPDIAMLGKGFIEIAPDGTMRIPIDPTQKPRTDHLTGKWLSGYFYFGFENGGKSPYPPGSIELMVIFDDKEKSVAAPEDAVTKKDLEKLRKEILESKRAAEAALKAAEALYRERNQSEPRNDPPDRSGHRHGGNF